MSILLRRRSPLPSDTRGGHINLGYDFAESRFSIGAGLAGGMFNFNNNTDLDDPEIDLGIGGKLDAEVEIPELGKFGLVGSYFSGGRRNSEGLSAVVSGSITIGAYSTNKEVVWSLEDSDRNSDRFQDLDRNGDGFYDPGPGKGSDTSPPPSGNQDSNNGGFTDLDRNGDGFYDSWGEGWHNNHHANPRAWSYREKWWEWDPGAAVVWVILRLSRRNEHCGAAPRTAA